MKTLERYVVDEHGKKKDIIISFRKYEKLLADIHDLAIVAERRDEPTVSMKDVYRKL